MPNAMFLAVFMLLLGFLVKRTHRLPENAADSINRIVLDLCLPCLVLQVVPEIEFNASVGLIAVIAWVVMLLSALVLRALCRALKYSREVEGCLLLTAILGNTAFLGYPLTRAYLGDSAVGLAVIYDQLGSFLMFSTFGLWVAAHYGGGKAPSALETTKRIVFFPAFIALLGALIMVYGGWQLPAMLRYATHEIGDMLVPLAMFSVGLNWQLVPPKGFKTPLLIGLAFKMLLAPLLAIALAHVLLDGDAKRVTVLQATMPPMVTAAALASGARLAPALAGAMAGFGILLAIFWTPLLLGLLR